MENLIINKTTNTPSVIFDIEEKTLSLCGNSLPENPTEFYMIIDDYVNSYSQQYQNEKLNIILDITYMNTSSSKRIFSFVKKCVERFKVVNVTWLFDSNDDDMYEQGKEFEHTLGINFDFQIKQ